MESIIKWVAASIAALSVIVEIEPHIKVNPWSWLLRRLGRLLNAETLDSLKETNKELEALSKKMDDHEIDQLRWNILDFANSCRNGTHHSKEEFAHVFAAFDNYERILHEKNMTNGQVSQDFAFIRKIYDKCLEENSFLS